MPTSNELLPTSTWDFFSGRGEGATRADRSAAQLRRPLTVLAQALYHSEAFWDHALDVSRANDQDARAAQLAALYVPRKGRNGERSVIVKLLLIAAENLVTRYDRKQRPGLALKRMAEAGGIFAYAVDGGPLVTRPNSTNRRIKFGGSAASDASLRSLQLGADLIVKRGSGICLSRGCCEAIDSRRLPTPSPYRHRQPTERADYCPRHLSCEEHEYHLDIMRAILVPAADAALR